MRKNLLINLVNKFNKMPTDEEIAAAREKLKKRLGNIQTGGKGTVRRKKKVEGGNIMHRITDEERTFCNSIEKLNGKILELSKEYYEIWKFYLDDYFMDMCQNIKKREIKRTKDLNLEYIRNNIEDFCSSNFLQKHNNIEIFRKSFKDLKNLFTPEGYDFYLDNINYLITALDKKEYLETEGDDGDKENINVHLERLGLDINEIPSKAQIKKNYLIKSTKFHPDKHPTEHDKYSQLFQDIQKSYKTLNEYYYPVKKEITYDIN